MLIRKEFADEVNRFYRQPVLWSRSYCAISCSGAPLSVIKQYIERQSAPEQRASRARLSPPASRLRGLAGALAASPVAFEGSVPGAMAFIGSPVGPGAGRA